MYFSNKIVISNCGVIPNIYAIGMYFTYFESPFYPLQITNLLCHDPMTIYYSKWRLKNTCRKLRFSLKIFRSQPILTEKMARSKRGDQIEVFKILKGYENIDSNIFFEIKESKITRGHNFTLVKNKVDWMLESFHFPRGQSMYGINYQQSVYMLVVLMCSKIE